MDHSFKGYLENLKHLFESTLLNRISDNMRLTYSPRMSTNMSVISSATVDSDVSSVKEKDEKNILKEERTASSSNNKSTVEKSHGIPGRTSKSALKPDEISKLRQTETININSSTSLNKIKSLATVSTSNVNISVSNDIELYEEPTHVNDNDTTIDTTTEIIFDDIDMDTVIANTSMTANINYNVNEKSI